MSPSSASSPVPRTRRDARRGRGRRARRGGWGRRLLLWLVALGLLAALVGALVFAWAYRQTTIPQPNDFASSQSTILYYADGSTEMARLTGGHDRESVPLSQVPEHVQKAMLAAEDRSFYTNDGVSLTGTARAAWRTLTSNQVQGGSTITQQYVKNYYLTADQTLRRKLRELMISIKIDNELSKDQILQNYLNTIYYGRGAYGIETAAQAYFRKDVKDLTVGEGAFLAAVTNAPSNLDPAAGSGNEQRARARVAYVLDGMVAEGWLTQAQRDATTFPEIKDPPRSTAYTGTGGYVAAAARAEIARITGLDPATIESSGLRVTTTIQQKHQRAAVAAVKEYRPRGQNAGDITVGLTAIRPGDGAITAMYGGSDYQKSQLNAATDARVQAGSLFKPITLAAAVADGIDTYTTFQGPSPMTFGANQTEVNNFQDVSYGLLDLRTALAFSVNTIYVQLNERIGPEKTVKMAEALGIPKDTPGLGNDLTNVLGTASPTLVQMTNAYATLAAGGERATPYLVTKVVSAEGTVLYEAKPRTHRAVSEAVAADVTEAMTQVMLQGSGTTAGDIGRPDAGKSGTSENNVSAWFDGFTPQLAAGVLLYKGDGTVQMHDVGGVAQVTGGSFPAQIWGEFMRRATEGDEVVAFPPRVGAQEAVQTTVPEPTAVTQAPTTTAPTTSATPVPTTSAAPTTSSAPTTTSVPPSPSPTSATPTPSPAPTVTGGVPAPTSPAPTGGVPVPTSPVPTP